MGVGGRPITHGPSLPLPSHPSLFYHDGSANAAIDRYLLLAGPTAANLQQWVRFCRTDRQAD